TAVYAADTGVSRQEHASDRWTRELEVIVPVSAPALWTGEAHRLGALLRFLTGDYWTLRFQQRGPSLDELLRKTEVAGEIDIDTVSLFSGGLDSLIGALDLLAEGRKPLLISHYWDGEASAAQARLL